MAGIALKTVNPVVFDDPDYCNGENGRCKYICGGCRLFPIKLGASRLLYSDPKKKRLKKCQQCKDHYNQNKK